MVRHGDLVRVRRGAYLAGPLPTTPAGVREQHRRLIHATLGQSGDRNVVSHMSAAVLHGLPIWSDQLERVQVIRDRPGGGRSRRHVVVRGMLLADEDVEMVEGVATTTLARTVVDLACQLPMRRSVAIGDAALRTIAETDPGRDLRTELAEVLDRATRRPGVPTARRAVAFFDPRSESPGESCSRVVMHERGLPPPELQYEIVDDNGLLVARCDFAWPEPAYGRRARRPGEVLRPVRGEHQRGPHRREAPRGRHPLVRLAGRPLDLGGPPSAGRVRRHPEPGLRPEPLDGAAVSDNAAQLHPHRTAAPARGSCNRCRCSSGRRVHRWERGAAARSATPPP